MLTFYTDSALTRPITAATPKLFCVPLEGGTRQTKIYLGDGYRAPLAASCLAGASTLVLAQTTEFLAGGGTASLGTINAFRYKGKTATTLTGVTGITAGFASGSLVKPNLMYMVSGNFLVGVAGSDALGELSQIAVALKRADQVSYGFRGTPVIYQTASLSSQSSLEIDLSVTVNAGSIQTYTNLQLLFSGFVIRAAETPTPVSSGEATLSLVALLQVGQRNQGVTVTQRLFPLNRKISPNLPGFVVGDYRWRDKDSLNALPILPTNWNVDLSKIPSSNFVSGIAHGTDLAPVTVELAANSLFLRIQSGFYFNSNIRSYLPAASLLEIFSSTALTSTYTLQQSPASQTPIYVGTWSVDQTGAFVKDVSYRYVGKDFESPQTDFQFTVDRAAKLITTNAPMPIRSILLGSVSGDPIDFFTIPIYPVGGVSQVYVDRGLAISRLVAASFTFDQQDGTLQVPSIPGAIVGQPVFATCSPAVAVLYAQAGVWTSFTSIASGTCITFKGFIYRAITSGVTGLTPPAFSVKIDAQFLDGSSLVWRCDGPVGTLRATADLNPAFAGISQGYLYLAQKYQGAYSIALSCDKPLVPIPASDVADSGIHAYGPIFYDGDYALLIATVLDSNNNPISNIELQVVPGTGFDGTVNYLNPLDPNAPPITVRTGGDGVANLIYTPKNGFGFYLPLANLSTQYIANDTITLAAPIALSQLWNSIEGWLPTLYQVQADNAYYGMLNANTAAGQIPFTTSGTPGTTSYRTNGRRVALLSTQGKALLPIEARDNLGNLTTAPSFNGLVSQLTYASSLAGTTNVQAYFITYVERVKLRLVEVGSNVKSNVILLEMAPTPFIADVSPFLILDNLTSGMLNVQRLSYFGAPTYFPGTILT